jgi:hypothetical protein
VSLRRTGLGLGDFWLVMMREVGMNGSDRFGDSGPVNRPAWAENKFQEKKKYIFIPSTFTLVRFSLLLGFDLETVPLLLDDIMRGLAPDVRTNARIRMSVQPTSIRLCSAPTRALHPVSAPTGRP